MADKDPKAKNDADRQKQAAKLVLKQIRKSRPEFQDADVKVVWTQASRGDGDWRALVLVNGAEETIYSVGYNYETEALYVDVYQQQAQRHH